MQCPEIISWFPEVISSLPIPGKISIFPEKFCCSPETGLVRVVTPRTNDQRSRYARPGTQASCQLITKLTPPKPINTTTCALFKTATSKILAAPTYFLRRTVLQSTFHGSHSRSFFMKQSCSPNLSCKVKENLDSQKNKSDLVSLSCKVSKFK